VGQALQEQDVALATSDGTWRLTPPGADNDGSEDHRHTNNIATTERNSRLVTRFTQQVNKQFHRGIPLVTLITTFTQPSSSSATTISWSHQQQAWSSAQLLTVDTTSPQTWISLLITVVIYVLALVGLCYIVIQACHRGQRLPIMTFDGPRSSSAGVETDAALPEPVPTQNVADCNDNTRTTCKYYYRGYCRRQDRCHYYHDPESPAAKLTEEKISRMFAELDWSYAVEWLGLLLDARPETLAEIRSALLDHVEFFPQDNNPRLPNRMVVPLDGTFPHETLRHHIDCMGDNTSWQSNLINLACELILEVKEPTECIVFLVNYLQTHPSSTDETYAHCCAILEQLTGHTTPPHHHAPVSEDDGGVEDDTPSEPEAEAICQPSSNMQQNEPPAQPKRRPRGGKRTRGGNGSRPGQKKRLRTKHVHLAARVIQRNWRKSRERRLEPRYITVDTMTTGDRTIIQCVDQFTGWTQLSLVPRATNTDLTEAAHAIYTSSSATSDNNEARSSTTEENWDDNEILWHQLEFTAPLRNSGFRYYDDLYFANSGFGITVHDCTDRVVFAYPGDLRPALAMNQTHRWYLPNEETAGLGTQLLQNYLSEAMLRSPQQAHEDYTDSYWISVHTSRTTLHNSTYGVDIVLTASKLTRWLDLHSYSFWEYHMIREGGQPFIDRWPWASRESTPELPDDVQQTYQQRIKEEQVAQERLHNAPELLFRYMVADAHDTYWRTDLDKEYSYMWDSTSGPSPPPRTSTSPEYLRIKQIVQAQIQSIENEATALWQFLMR